MLFLGYNTTLPETIKDSMKTDENERKKRKMAIHCKN